MGFGTSGNSSTQGGNALMAVKVMDIILDLKHESAEKYGFWDGLGTIFYLRVNEIIGNPSLERNWQDSTTIKTARPLLANQKYYPLVGEIVLIMSAPAKSVVEPRQAAYYLPNINVWNHPHHNAIPNPLAMKEGDTKQDYKNAQGGLVRHVTDGSTDIKLGKYFKEKLNTKPLLPYEGDHILEGRHGNSIRFGSTIPTDKIDEANANDWSEAGDLGDPITIIRNGQSEELDQNGWEPTIEDINRDSTSIYMTSNQQISSLNVSFLKWESWGAEYEPPVDNLQALTSPPIKEVEQEVIEETTSPVEETSSDPSIYDPPEPKMVEEEDASTPPPTVEEEDDDELSMFDELIDSGDYDVDDFEEGELAAVSGQDVATSLEERAADGETVSETGGTNSSTGDSSWADNREKYKRSKKELYETWGYPNWQYPAKIPGKTGITTTVQKPAPFSSIKSNLGPKATNKKYLVIHCTAGAHKPPVESVLGMMYGDRGVKALGGSRAGYHLMIQADGKVCKIYDDTFTAYGASGYNGTGIHINWMGGVSSFNMTNAQAKVLTEVVRTYVDRYPDIQVLGHNQVADKSCPRFWVPSYMKALGYSDEKIFYKSDKYKNDSGVYAGDYNNIKNGTVA